MELRLRVQKLRDGARLPSYATPGAAGLDLHACLDEPLDLAPGSVVLVPSGIAVAIPAGYVGLVRDRSGMARKGILTVAGVIDSDYRGEVMVAVHNAAPSIQRIEPRDRIAQMLVLPCAKVTVEATSELPASQRGSGGFGSTGR